jgi:hypothetical protein
MQFMYSLSSIMIVALVVQRKNAYSFSYSVIINTELKTKSCVGGHLKLQIHRKIPTLKGTIQ